jgi:peroxiredoxin family protein
MTADEIDRLYDAVMLAAPLAALGIVLLVLVWRWPVRRKP